METTKFKVLKWSFWPIIILILYIVETSDQKRKIKELAEFWVEETAYDLGMQSSSFPITYPMHYIEFTGQETLKLFDMFFRRDTEFQMLFENRVFYKRGSQNPDSGQDQFYIEKVQNHFWVDFELIWRENRYNILNRSNVWNLKLDINKLENIKSDTPKIQELK